MSETLYDVGIVGAGLAGLMAARRVIENNHSVVMMEAKDYVGGRTLTAKSPIGSPVDLGAMFVGKSEKRVLKLVEEFKLHLHPVFFSGKVNQKIFS